MTSHRAGLSVPDWPTTYGQFMFSFPMSKWVGNILYEHGHRLIASVVGMLTIVLAFWLVRVEPRRWVRRLGIAALAVVIAQGILGGLTVKLMLPPSISIAHACLAEAFFCVTVALAFVTSENMVATSASRRGPRRALGTAVDPCYDHGGVCADHPRRDHSSCGMGCLRAHLRCRGGFWMRRVEPVVVLFTVKHRAFIASRDSVARAW